MGLGPLEFRLGIRVRFLANRVRIRAIEFSIRVIRVNAIRVGVGFMVRVRAVRVRASMDRAIRVRTIGVSVRVRAVRVSVKNMLKFLLGLEPLRIRVRDIRVGVKIRFGAITIRISLRFRVRGYS